MGDEHDAGEWSWGPEDNSNGGDPDPVGEMNKRSAETPALQQGKLRHTNLKSKSVGVGGVFLKHQKQVRFQQINNQGLRQLFLTVSWDLHG